MAKINTDQAKINELLTRGVTEVIERGELEKALLSGKKLRVKLGFDPTGDNIHIGRAIVLRKLRDFQRLGHKVVFLVGDFTARIGDPSDKLSKRPMLSKERIKENLKTYKKQVGKIIDLRQAEFRFNSQWLKKLGFEEIAQLAESFTVQQMLARRNFKNRFEKGEEISVREMMYPLMQGYDSVALKADVELGGSDQLFNLTAGRTIQRHYNQNPQNVLTVEMLEGTDGRKMSTSWGNVVNIVEEPSEMFGKIMSVKDELVEKYFLLCTDFSQTEIKAILQEQEPKERKIILAKAIVALYHSEEDAQKAAAEFNRIFGQGSLPSEIEEITISQEKMTALDLVFETKLVESRGEARRIIEQGGVKINEEKVKDGSKEIKIEDGLIVQIGKRRWVKIKK